MRPLAPLPRKFLVSQDLGHNGWGKESVKGKYAWRKVAHWQFSKCGCARLCLPLQRIQYLTGRDVPVPCILALTSFLSQTIKSDPVLLWKPFHQSLGAPSVTHVFKHPTALQMLEQPSSTGIRDRSHKKM